MFSSINNWKDTTANTDNKFPKDGDTVYITTGEVGDADIEVILDNDITISKLWLDSRNEKKITINLNDHTLTVSELYFGYNSDYNANTNLSNAYKNTASENDSIHVIIKGSGTFEANTATYKNKAESEIYLNDNVLFITGSLNGIAGGKLLITSENSGRFCAKNYSDPQVRVESEKVTDYTWDSTNSSLGSPVTEYTWNGGTNAVTTYNNGIPIYDEAWTNSANWSPSTGYPVNADDTAIFTGKNDVQNHTVAVDTDISISKISAHTGGEETITFAVAAGATLKCDTFESSLRNTGGHTTVIGGSGVLECGVFSLNKSTDSNTYTVQVDSTLRMTDSATGFVGVKGNGCKVNFTGSGSLYIPGDGEILDDVGAVTDSIYSIAGTINLRASSDAQYYSAAFDSESLKLTLKRKQASGEEIRYNYVVDEVSGTFSYGGTNFTANETATFPLNTSALSQEFTIDHTSTDAADYFTLRIRTPDNRFDLATIYYPTGNITVTDTKTYYWNGKEGDSWTDSKKWLYKGTRGSSSAEAYVSVADYTDENNISYDGHYPGYEDNDTAVFDKGDSASNPTLGGTGWNLTIKNTETSTDSNQNRAVIVGSGENADSANVTAEGYILFDSCILGSLTTSTAITEPTSIQITNYSARTLGRDYGLELKGDLTITAPSRLYQYGNNSVKVGGSISNAGSIEIADGVAVFAGAYSGNGNVTLSTGSLTFIGDAASTVENLSVTGAGRVTNNGGAAVNVQTVSVTGDGAVFTGDFTSVGTFTASAVNTYFVNGNVNFSAENSSFMANGGTVYFYRKSDDTATKRTFTTKDGMVFNDLYFGGNVDIALNGTVSAQNCKMNAVTDIDDGNGNRTSSYFQNEPFTAVFTETGSLTATSIEIDRMSETDGVIGTLEFAAGASVTDFTVHSGTTVTIDVGKTLTVENYARSGGEAGSPALNLNINGGLTVNTKLDVQADYDSVVTIGADGRLTANANSTISVKTLRNEGGVYLVVGGSALSFAAYSGRDDSQDMVSSEGGTITCTADADMGIIGKLTVSGATTVGYGTGITGHSFNVGLVTINNGFTLTAQSDLAVSGDWGNNNTTGNGFDADTNAVTFTKSANISGNTTFYDLICAAGGETLTFAAGSTQTITNALRLNGSEGKELALKSSADGTVWNISVPVDSASVSYVSVQDSVSANDSILAENSTDLGNNTWWNCKDFDYTWTGADTTSPHDWRTQANWSPASVPGKDANAIIPDSLTYYPELSSAERIANLTIGTDDAAAHTALFTLSDSATDFAFTVSSALTNYGTIVYAGAARIENAEATAAPINDTEHGGTVEYSGGTAGSPQEVTHFAGAGGADYANLVISSTAAQTADALMVNGNLVVKAGGSLALGANLSLLGNCDIEASGTVSATSGTLTFSGNGAAAPASAQTLTVADGANVQFASIEIAESAAVSAAGSFTVAGNWTNSSTAESGFAAESGTITFSGSNVTVSGKNTFSGVAVNTANAQISFTDANSFASLSFTGAGTTVSFAAGKTQTVTQSLKSVGIAARTITLTSNASPQTLANESTWWILNLPETVGKAIPVADFAYTQISYAKSVNDISHEWAGSVTEAVRDSTENWFLTTFYWLGTADSKWTTAANWAYSADSTSRVTQYPSHNTGKNTIIIATAAGGNNLVLSEDGFAAGTFEGITVKSLTVNEGKTVDFAAYSVTASDSDDTTADIVNNGTVRLVGAAAQSVTGTIENGADSTVEYYETSAGDFSALSWGTSYQNLTIGTDTDRVSAVDVTDALTIGGEAQIFASGDITLSGANTIDGAVSVASGGAVTLNGLTRAGEGFLLSAATCDSLAVNSAVRLVGNVTTTGAQTYAGAVTVSGEAVLVSSTAQPLAFAGNVSIASDAALTFGATDSEYSVTVGGNWLNEAGASGFVANKSTVTLTGNNVTVSGENTFSTLKAETAGAQISFAAGATLSVGVLSIKGTATALVTFGGESEWTFAPSDISKVSVAHAEIKNSANTNTAPIIVYAKDGYNVDGGGNTNWIFAGQEYEWTGASGTNDWNTAANWSPASVPQSYSVVTIPSVAGGNYPILAADLNLDAGSRDFDIEGEGGTTRTETVSSAITVESGAAFDFAGFALTVNRLALEETGRLRVLGTEELGGIASLNPSDPDVQKSPDVTQVGIIDYYGAFATPLIFGNTYHQLEFTAGADGTLGATGTISDALSVSGATLIANGSANAISFTGANSFGSLVEIGTATAPAGNITLSGENVFAGGVSIAGAGAVALTGAGADGAALLVTGNAICDSLVLESAVEFEGSLTARAAGTGGTVLLRQAATLGGNVTSTGAQTYESAVSLSGDVVFDAGAENVMFRDAVSAVGSLGVKSPALLYGNITSVGSQTYEKSISLYGDVVFDAGSAEIVLAVDPDTPLTVGAGTDAPSAQFKSTVRTDSELVLSVPAVSFAESAPFVQSDSRSLTLASGTALSFGSATFTSGSLIVSDGASFTQSGVNGTDSEQTVYGIQNDGVCVWDSASEGGTVLLEGSIGGSRAAEVVFNRKNVTIAAQPATISGVFFDLTIPQGISVTNGSGICVRRNLTVSGAYLHNDQPLTLGSIAVDGVTYHSAENESADGTKSPAEIASAASSLGAVSVTQETTRKAFVTAIEAATLTLSDTTAGAGSLAWRERLTADTVVNADGTDFDILFESGCAVAQAVVFGTSGLLSLGTHGSDSAAFASAAEPSVTHTSGKTTLAGTLVAQGGAVFAETALTQNTLIDCAQKSVTVTGSLSAEGESGENVYSLTVGTALSATAARFGGNVTVGGLITVKGSVSAFGADVVIRSGQSYILADGSASRSWGAESGTLTFASDTYIDLSDSAQISFASGISWGSGLYVYAGELVSGAVSHSVGGNFVLFGANYSADDPRYAGADTRFAYFGASSLAYQPSASIFAARLTTEGTSISVGGNCYLNGLDLANCAFVLPDCSESKPEFNPSSEVTQSQWGIPYAAVFNARIASCTAQARSGSAFFAAALSQNVTDGAGNTGFQFSVPQVSEAYSVSDSVICLSFDMTLENSGGEAEQTIARIASLADGGIFYNKNGTKDGLLAFDGILYTASDGTSCSAPLAESEWNKKDIPALTKLYLKVASTEYTWNTDATARSVGSADSTDRSGVYREHTTDLSFMEGLFYAADGKTMCRNYGIGLWSESDTAYTEANLYETIDRARPVLVDVFVGQELHTKNTGTADSQKPYDAHNFIEFRYSEPVDIGDLASGAAENNQNVQAQTAFGSALAHGGAIARSGSALSVAGFATIASGEVTAGWRDGDSHTPDTAKPHALYRRFARQAGGAEAVQENRIRISVAGYVDETNPISLDGNSFHNWIGYIDSAQTPSGKVTVAANQYITDRAVDTGGNALKNPLDEQNSSRSIAVNDRASSFAASEVSLYGDWDCLSPVFAAYVTNLNGQINSWEEGDGEERVYEIVGTVDSNTSAYLDRIELHLFDNAQDYASDDEYKWVSQSGWTQDGVSLEDYSAPESAGGKRAFSSGANKTYGGIRRSSLAGASSAFTYVYKIDSAYSSERAFAGSETSQHVKSMLFRNKNLTVTATDDDGAYISLPLNERDTQLPIRTGFTLTYTPENSFITDLAGNRLIQTDSGKATKTLKSVDITPPSFSVTLAPVGEDKLYAVFTKPLAYQKEYLEQSASLATALDNIKSNIEFVYSADDDIDIPQTVSGISVEKVELASHSADYTALLFTLNRKIALDDVEKIWLRINAEGDEVETFAGKTIASFLQDINGNAVPFHTCHAISDFAVNAVNVLYAYSVSDAEEGWDEQGLYGIDVAPLSDDYAVHDFSAEGGNYAKLRSGTDIVFQMQYVGGASEAGELLPFENGESLMLVIDKPKNLRSDWISDKFNLLTGGDWRIWLDARLYSLASGFNTDPLLINSGFESVGDGGILHNMTLSNDEFKFVGGDSYQFFFKILGSDGEPILLNHDGDKTTPEIPLYAFRMPEERIRAGDFSFIDLWSFSLSDITRQRGGVTILNNVINASVGEKTAIEVEMKREGNLNVTVMTLDGNIVKRLAKGTVSAGTHYYYWDGKNNAGNPVARGLYFVRVSGSGIDETRKVMVIKK